MAPRHPDRPSLTRTDLPAELTPESLRNVGFRTLGAFARPNNGVLDAQEQRQFDAALAELRRGASALADESLRRARRGEPSNLDPALRRSYERAQQRLAQQAERARRRFPDLAPDASPAAPETAEPEITPTDEPSSDDDSSPNTLEQEVEQTSDTLDMLERIASLQQQLLEHQQTQLRNETRGVFFGLLVSITVIIAGVAPLVEAEPHNRLLIALWTVAAVAVAGLVYAAVRWAQAKK